MNKTTFVVAVASFATATISCRSKSRRTGADNEAKQNTDSTYTEQPATAASVHKLETTNSMGASSLICVLCALICVACNARLLKRVFYQIVGNNKKETVQSDKRANDSIPEPTDHNTDEAIEDLRCKLHQQISDIKKLKEDVNNLIKNVQELRELCPKKPATVVAAEKVEEPNREIKEQPQEEPTQYRYFRPMNGGKLEEREESKASYRAWKDKKGQWLFEFSGNANKAISSPTTLILPFCKEENNSRTEKIITTKPGKININDLSIIEKAKIKYE